MSPKIRSIRSFSALAAVFHFFRKERPAIAIATQPKAIFPLWCAMRITQLGAPSVFILHRMPRPLHASKMDFDQRFLVWFANRMDIVVFPSRLQMQAWLAIGLRPRRVAVIGNGVDVVRFSPEVAESKRSDARKHFGFENDDIVIGTCCMFRNGKRLDLLIDAVSLLRKTGRRVKALLVGDGEKRIELEKQVNSLGLNEFVVFAGLLQDVTAPIAAMDIGIMCTSGEVFNLFAAECMAMGRPMLMANAGGSPEVIDHGITGALFEPGNAQSIVSEITPFLDAEIRLKIGKAATRVAHERLSLDTMIDRYRALFSDLAGPDLFPPNNQGELSLYELT